MFAILRQLALILAGCIAPQLLVENDPDLETVVSLSYGGLQSLPPRSADSERYNKRHAF